MAAVNTIEIYRKILEHPTIKALPEGQRIPPLGKFRSWDQEKRLQNLAAFRSMNPTIYFESLEGKKIIGTRRVETKEKDIFGRSFVRDEIIWGDPLA